MKIKNELQNIEYKNSLIVVTSNQESKMYLVKNDNIDLVDSFFVETPEYSDREGFFTSSGKRGVYGSGSVYEDKNEYIKDKFNHSLLENLLKEIEINKAEALYMFMPENNKNDVINILPDKIKEIIKMEIYGNYVGEHPFVFLTMIKERLEKEGKNKIVELIKKEAKKILDKETEEVN